MTTQFFKRPAANYAGEAGLPNRTKYYTDSTSSPKVPISSTKVDGDINYLIDAVNALYDTAVSGVVGDGSITNVKLRDSGACSVIGRAANTTGSPADISAATNGTVLVRKSNQVQFSTIPAGAFETGAIATSDLADTAVSFGKIQNVSTGVVLGRSSSGAGPVEALTAGTGLTVSAGAISVPDASTTVKGVVELATNAEAQAATSSTVAITPTNLLAAFSHASVYESGELTITTTPTTVTHNLGRKPRHVEYFLRCKTAQYGYSVGDEIMFGGQYSNDGGAFVHGIACCIPNGDVNSIIVLMGNSFTPLMDKGTGAVTAGITAANWRVVVRVWA